MGNGGDTLLLCIWKGKTIKEYGSIRVCWFDDEQFYFIPEEVAPFFIFDVQLSPYVILSFSSVPFY